MAANTLYLHNAAGADIKAVKPPEVVSGKRTQKGLILGHTARVALEIGP